MPGTSSCNSRFTVAIWSWPELQMCERKRWYRCSARILTSGTLPLAMSRMEGSAELVANLWIASTTHISSTSPLNMTMMYTTISTFMSSLSSTTAPSVLSQVSTPPPEKSLMNAPPRKTHTSENCAAIACVLMSGRA